MFEMHSRTDLHDNSYSSVCSKRLTVGVDTKLYHARHPLCRHRRCECDGKIKSRLCFFASALYIVTANAVLSSLFVLFQFPTRPFLLRSRKVRLTWNFSTRLRMVSILIVIFFANLTQGHKITHLFELKMECATPICDKNGAVLLQLQWQYAHYGTLGW